MILYCFIADRPFPLFYLLYPCSLLFSSHHQHPKIIIRTLWIGCETAASNSARRFARLLICPTCKVGLALDPQYFWRPTQSDRDNHIYELAGCFHRNYCGINPASTADVTHTSPVLGQYGQRKEIQDPDPAGKGDLDSCRDNFDPSQIALLAVMLPPLMAASTPKKNIFSSNTSTATQNVSLPFISNENTNASLAGTGSSERTLRYHRSP